MFWEILNFVHYLDKSYEINKRLWIIFLSDLTKDSGTVCIILNRFNFCNMEHFEFAPCDTPRKRKYRRTTVLCLFSLLRHSCHSYIYQSWDPTRIIRIQDSVDFSATNKRSIMKLMVCVQFELWLCKCSMWSRN